jgi:hypothetical protein
MPAGDDDLEALDPMARLLVSHLRQENAELRAQLAKNSELIQRLTEQVEALNRRLFGKRSEKIPTVREELRQQITPGELTVDGDPMPEQPEARAKEKRRKARKASEPERQKRRRARKDIPTIVEVREVQADGLPEGYSLEDFRVVGDGKVRLPRFGGHPERDYSLRRSANAAEKITPRFLQEGRCPPPDGSRLENRY